MPRTAISVIQAPGTVDPAVANLTLTAGDTANNHDWTIRDGDILIAHNTGVGSQVATLKGTADAQGRTADSAKTILAGKFAVFGPLKRLAWQQSTGKAHVDVDSNDVDLVVISGA